MNLIASGSAPCLCTFRYSRTHSKEERPVVPNLLRNKNRSFLGGFAEFKQLPNKLQVLIVCELQNNNLLKTFPKQSGSLHNGRDKTLEEVIGNDSLPSLFARQHKSVTRRSRDFLKLYASLTLFGFFAHLWRSTATPVVLIVSVNHLLCSNHLSTATLVPKQVKRRLAEKFLQRALTASASNHNPALNCSWAERSVRKKVQSKST